MPISIFHEENFDWENQKFAHDWWLKVTENYVIAK